MYRKVRKPRGIFSEEVINQRSFKGRTDEAMTFKKVGQSFHQQFLGIRLEQIAGRTCQDSSPKHLNRIMHGQNQDFDFREGFAQNLGDLKSIGRTHRNVSDDDIRMELNRHLDSLSAVAGFTTDLVLTIGFQNRAHTTPHDRMVVCEQDPELLGP